MDLGLDSMMAVDFVTDLGATIGYELSATLTFDYPTMHQVARHLSEDVLPELLEGSEDSFPSSAGSFEVVTAADATGPGVVPYEAVAVARLHVDERVGAVVALRVVQRERRRGAHLCSTARV
jgi:hypothetical protein